MPIYMKIEGIEGTVTGKYKGWIELESCQLGVNRHLNNRSETGGAPSVSEIVITKFQDASSPALFKEALYGSGKKVSIDFVQGNEAPYLSIELENTLISNYSVSGRGGQGNEKPMESLTLNFTKITYSTKPTSTSKDTKNSPDKATWDLAVSKGS